MKKILKTMILLVGVMALTAGCGKKDSEGKFEIAFDKVIDANDGFNLLDKYEAIQYTMHYAGDDGYDDTLCTLAKNGDGPVYSIEKSGATTVYCSQGSYKDEPGHVPEYTVGWFMPKKYDSIMKASVGAFLVEETDGEDIISEDKDGDNTIITTKSSDEGSEYHYKYTVNSKSYEIQKFEVYAVTDGEESLVASSNIDYNINYQTPEFLSNLINPEFSREFTVVVDPGKDTEKTYKNRVPKNALIKTYLEDNYTLYQDEQGKDAYKSENEQADVNGEYADRTVYCIK